MTRVQFDDSEVARVQWQGSAVALHFSAARLEDQRQDREQHAASAFLTGVELRIEQATVDEPGNVLDMMGRLREGHLRLTDGSFLKSLPLPFATDHAVRLSVGFANGEHLQVRGAAAALIAGPHSSRHDDFRC